MIIRKGKTLATHLQLLLHNLSMRELNLELNGSTNCIDVDQLGRGPLLGTKSIENSCLFLGLLIIREGKTLTTHLQLLPPSLSMRELNLELDGSTMPFGIFGVKNFAH